MMEHIIKSLATKDTATVILALGLIREARLWHKQILEHKRKLQNKKVEKGATPQPLLDSVPSFAVKSNE
ncbi:hypothetical protein U750_11270 [Streptococcus pseudopneumoniae G42]|nr:hypothetical protein U750_11270 [Streptococcus pseudopneumoniae G42]